ncbi:hypothetical protein QNH36_11255 [Mesobacillus sp. AQ2]|uniref:hypothetical protein n=1 Tax=Mesobacillus sp. AQ2 TaxID=3043332 RepID=UPI0024C101B7|nr:hypothetical protein [Mesobacillus sp. AQ2]WHX42662.1 hypothetical protein QNH36_11255 [Mesobacillus sp. AQ2]
MNYYSVLKDLNKMKNIPLQSINPGAEVVILEINDSNIIIQSSSGKIVKRPLAEIKKLVKSLTSKKPIHVDTVLGGSGSSRNQPETVLANLPYVEWLRIKRKKHIVWVDENTHIFGTNKEMDSVRAALVKTQLHSESVLHEEKKNLLNVTVVFCDNLQEASYIYKSILKKEPELIEKDQIIFSIDKTVIILKRNVYDLPDGSSAPIIPVDNLDSRCAELDSLFTKIIKIPANEKFPSHAIIIGNNNYIIILSEALL